MAAAARRAFSRDSGGPTASHSYGRTLPPNGRIAASRMRSGQKHTRDSALRGGRDEFPSAYFFFGDHRHQMACRPSPLLIRRRPPHLFRAMPTPTRPWPGAALRARKLSRVAYLLSAQISLRRDDFGSPIEQGAVPSSMKQRLACRASGRVREGRRQSQCPGCQWLGITPRGKLAAVGGRAGGNLHAMPPLWPLIG